MYRLMFLPLAVIFSGYLLLFDREVNLVWSRKLTGVSAIFYLNRYITLAKAIVNILKSGLNCP